MSTTKKREAHRRPSPSGAELAQKALKDPEGREVREQLEFLSPEEAATFVTIVELTLKKRRLMLVGHLAALFALLAGLILAVYIFGTSKPGRLAAWIFFLPPAAAAFILIVFGKIVARVQLPRSPASKSKDR